MININELTTDHKIKLKKPMGCFDNLGEVCEIVKIDTDENVINFRFGVDGVHLGVMSGDELENILMLLNQLLFLMIMSGIHMVLLKIIRLCIMLLRMVVFRWRLHMMEMEQFLLCTSTLKILIGKLKMGKEVGFIVKI